MQSLLSLAAVNGSIAVVFTTVTRGACQCRRCGLSSGLAMATAVRSGTRVPSPEKSCRPIFCLHRLVTLYIQVTSTFTYSLDYISRCFFTLRFLSPCCVQYLLFGVTLVVSTNDPKMRPLGGAISASTRPNVMLVSTVWCGVVTFRLTQSYLTFRERCPDVIFSQREQSSGHDNFTLKIARGRLIFHKY